MADENEFPVLIVAGLGNPGRKYEKTRHNIGFDVLDLLLTRFPGALVQGKFDGKYTKLQWNNRQCVLLWPETFMNRSGQSISAAARFFKSPLTAILVICDDLSLPLGKLRLRRSGSSGGQKGLQDTIEKLGSSDFARLRIGIGSTPENWETSDYVLSKFVGKEQDVVNAACHRAADAIECWLVEGIDMAMNKFNRE